MTLEAVYPRWRGEHSSIVSTPCNPAGLSPLARGTPLNPGGVTRTQRFIPAGAGNTSRGGCISPGCAVYPRWRGEHQIDDLVADIATGLSPLARGTRVVGDKVRPDQRFIPAGAGNTRGQNAAIGHSPVYPRWRGEH